MRHIQFLMQLYVAGWNIKYTCAIYCQYHQIAFQQLGGMCLLNAMLSRLWKVFVSQNVHYQDYH